MRELNIKTEPELIGGGGNSKVYECYLEDDYAGQKVILKIGANIDTNISNYEVIKSLGIPTLDFVESANYCSQTVLVTNHLNTESLIFVTPNSVITSSQRVLAQYDSFAKTEIVEPFAENFRSDNKLTSILNLDKFIDDVLKDIEHASNSNIVIEYDSYFIGSEKLSDESDICYKIADLDNIFKCQDKSKEECFEINKSEFQRMLQGFIEHFVIEGVNKDEYKKALTNE